MIDFKRGYSVLAIAVLIIVTCIGCHKINEEEAASIVKERLQTKYGEEFEIKGLERRGRDGVPGFTHYVGVAYPINNPEREFSVIISADEDHEVMDDYVGFFVGEKLEERIYSYLTGIAEEYRVKARVHKEHKEINDINLTPEEYIALVPDALCAVKIMIPRERFEASSLEEWYEICKNIIADTIPESSTWIDIDIYRIDPTAIRLDNSRIEEAFDNYRVFPYASVYKWNNEISTLDKFIEDFKRNESASEKYWIKRYLEINVKTDN